MQKRGKSKKAKALPQQNIGELMETIREFDRGAPEKLPKESKQFMIAKGTSMNAQTETESMVTRVALHPFLAGMNRTQLALLTDCAMAVQFDKGQVIFREGEQANRFYLIETGKVILESSGTAGEPVVIDTIGAGDLLGWSWMFPPNTWHFTARAVEPTKAIFFYGTILREYCEKDHSLGYELLKRMSVTMNRRMQAARNKMLAIHQGNETLPPVVSPFMEQEFDRYPRDNDDEQFPEGAA